jgi:hypothetical protein
MIEFSRGMMVKTSLSNAARKGCRTGILPAKSNTDITSDATDIMRDSGFDATKFSPPTTGSITIAATDPGGNSVSDAVNAPSGSSVSVTVSIPVSSTMWATSFLLKSDIVQSETVVMYKE